MELAPHSKVACVDSIKRLKSISFNEILPVNNSSNVFNGGILKELAFPKRTKKIHDLSTFYYPKIWWKNASINHNMR